MNDREYRKTIDYIYELIANGMMKTGDRLPTERTFSEKLGISRNSVREALKTLENLGLIESRQGSGNYLTNNVSAAIAKAVDIMLLMNCITSAEIGQFRRHMDKSVCNYLITYGCKEKYFEQMREAIGRMTTASERYLRTDADRDFHFILIHATENQLWITLFDAVYEVYRRLIDDAQMNADEETIAYLMSLHKGIYDALKKKDMAACYEMLDKHYDTTERLLSELEAARRG